jgi:hypothetical protein
MREMRTSKPGIRMNDEARMTNDRPASSSFVIGRSSLIRISGFVLLVSLLAVGGCNVIGFATATVAGMQNVPPMYVLPKRPTVVVAENFSDPNGSVRDDEPIARYVNATLEHGQLAPMIDPSQIYVMHHDTDAGRKNWHEMTVAALGRAVGADQVIYLNITECAVDTSQGSDMMRGTGAVMVRVVDTHTGASLWPTDSAEGYGVSAQTRIYREGQDNMHEPDVRAALHKSLADNITKIFTGYRTD